jgi:hypothetical protein
MGELNQQRMVHWNLIDAQVPDIRGELKYMKFSQRYEDVWFVGWDIVQFGICLLFIKLHGVISHSLFADIPNV